jgi:CRISPR locus-related DNA-binding protein
MLYVNLIIGETITRAYIISLGFDITTITFMFSRTTFERGDNIVFVMPEKDVPGKTRQTISAIEELLEGVKARGVSISYDYLKVSEEDFSKDLSTLINYTCKRGFSEIEVWAIGGTRAIVSLLSIYSLMDPRVSLFYTYSESKNRALKVPRIGFIEVVSDRDMVSILNFLHENGNTTIKKIMDSLSISQTKVYRVINKLKRMGLVNKLSGRRTKVTLNEWGKLYIHITRAMNRM